MDVKTILKTTKEKVDAQIFSEIELCKHSLPALGKTSNEALKRLAEFSVRGKGVRGAFTVLIAEMFGGDQLPALRVGAALEILHSSLLMQDDITDQDTLRRGAPTIWAQYKKDGDIHSSASSDLYGYSQAIYISDVGIFTVFRTIHEALFLHRNAKEIFDMFTQQMVMTGFGQMDDVYYGFHPDTIPNIEETNFIYEYKTARYTFSIPFMMGALIANQNEHLVEDLKQLGKEIGMLFQIRDDELGIISTEEELGKPIGSDIREDKKTPIRALFMKHAPQSVQHLFGNKKITIKEIKTVQEAYVQYGIAQEVKKIKQYYFKSAEQLIQKLAVSNKDKLLFSGLTQFVMERAK